MQKASSCASLLITSMILNLLKHWSTVRRRTKVILTLLTNEFLGRYANRARVLRGSFMPCFSELATESLPRYWNVQENKLMPLLNALWIDTKVSNISRELPYQQMPNGDGFEASMVELLGYLAKRSANENTYVCLAIFRTVRLL